MQANLVLEFCYEINSARGGGLFVMRLTRTNTIGEIRMTHCEYR